MSDKPETGQVLKIGITPNNQQATDVWIRLDRIACREEVDGYLHIDLIQMPREPLEHDDVSYARRETLVDKALGAFSAGWFLLSK